MNLVDEMKPPLTPMTATPYTPTIASAVTQPTPHYAWTADGAGASSLVNQQRRMSHSHSPASSERSTHSFGSTHAPHHMSPGASSTSSQDSPMMMAATPPLWEDGEPYKPAPVLLVDKQAASIDLAPLNTLPRSHVYRRCPADDRALRLLALAPGAR